MGTDPKGSKRQADEANVPTLLRRGWESWPGRVALRPGPQQNLAQRGQQKMQSRLGLASDGWQDPGGLQKLPGGSCSSHRPTVGAGGPQWQQLSTAGTHVGWGQKWQKWHLSWREG